jgi:transposase
LPLMTSLRYKENRKKPAQFACVECGFSENADLVGAINIRGESELANCARARIVQLRFQATGTERERQ